MPAEACGSEGEHREVLSSDYEPAAHQEGFQGYEWTPQVLFLLSDIVYFYVFN